MCSGTFSARFPLPGSRSAPWAGGSEPRTQERLQRSEKHADFPVPGAALPVVFRSYPEMVTGFFFILMTVLWFTREPGFVPGWDSFFEK